MSKREAGQLEKTLGNTMSEFKKFILKGNVIDMAVGVIIGGAFSKIVTSLVNDILMPALGAVTGGASFSDYKLVIHPAVLDEAQNVITPESVKNTAVISSDNMDPVDADHGVTVNPKEEEKPAAPAGPTTEELLAEIRDLLKEKNA